jgi:hypothetical protein
MKASQPTPAITSQSPGHLPPEHAAADDGIDRALLEESLAKTVWERMQANDDALQLVDLLQTAMTRNRAKPE